MLKNLWLLAVALVLISGQAQAVTNFPSVLDTDGGLGVAIPGTTVPSVHHNNLKDATLALENKVGVNGSAIVTTIDYLLKNPLSIDPGHKHSSSSLPASTAFTDAIQTWTAAQTFSGDVDFLGNVDFTSINGVSYVFPGVQGAASTYLKNDGAGNLSWSTISLPANVAYLDVIQTWTAVQSFQSNIAKINNVSYVFPAVQGIASTVLKNDGAGNLTWSTVAAVLPANVAYLDVIQTWTAAQSFQGNIGKINNVSYIFPAIQGLASTVLTNDGAGNLSWAVIPIVPGGLTGSVQFNNGGVFGGDAANFFWDNAAKRLGLGNPIPATNLDIAGNVAATVGILVKNSSTTGLSGSSFQNDTGGYASVSSYGTAYVGTRYGIAFSNMALFEGSGTTILGAGTANPLIFGVNLAEVARFDTTTYFGIGIITPAAKLHVKSGAVSDNLIQLTNDASQTGRIFLNETSAGISRFSILVNSATGADQEALVGIGNALTPTSQLHLLGPQPPAVSGAGTPALTPVTATGGKGGNTTGVTGQVAGAGGSFSFAGGAGGDAPAGSTNGAGGGFTFQLGTRGVGAGVTSGVLSGLFLVKGSSTHASTTGDVFNIQSSGGNLIMAAGRGAFRQVIVPDNLLVGSNNMASETFEAHGTVLLGGTFNSSTSSGLYIESGGGDADEGVRLRGVRKNATGTIRPILLQDTGLSVVGIGIAAGSIDTAQKLQIKGNALPGSGDKVVTITNNGMVGTGFLPASSTSLEITGSTYKSGASASLLTNVGLTINVTRPGANPADIARALSVQGGMTSIQFSPFVAVNGNNNDLSVSSSYVRITGPTAPFAITGVAGGSSSSISPYDGTLLVLRNTTVQTMTVSHASASSVVGNRFYISTGADFVIPAYAQASFVYDATSGYWVDVPSKTPFGEDSYPATVLTTNATPTTFLTVATSTDQNYFVHAKVLARQTGGSAGNVGDGGGFDCYATYRNVSGVLTEIGDSCLVEHRDDATWALDFSPSGTNILVRVTGATNKNITWMGTTNVTPN